MSLGITRRFICGRRRTPGLVPPMTPHSNDNAERHGTEPDDQDGDIMPGVVAGGEPAYPI